MLNTRLEQPEERVSVVETVMLLATNMLSVGPKGTTQTQDELNVSTRL